LYQRALDISEKLPRKEHPDTAVSIDGLAGLYEARGLYAESERLYQCALSIREKSLGKEHPDTRETLDSVARLHKKLSEQLIGKEGQIQLSALPAIIKAGQSTELIWSSKNADKAFLSCAGKVATEGTFTVTPNSTMDYILVVEGKLGIVSRTVNVQVTDAGSGDYPLTDYYFGYPVIDVYKNNSFIDLLDRIRHALLDKMSLSVSGPFPLSSGHYRFITGFTQRGDLVQPDERTIVRRISYLGDVGKNNNTGSEYKLTIRTSVEYRKLVEKTWRTEKNRDIMLAAAFRLKDVIGRAQK